MPIRRTAGSGIPPHLSLPAFQDSELSLSREYEQADAVLSARRVKIFAKHSNPSKGKIQNGNAQASKRGSNCSKSNGVERKRRVPTNARTNYTFRGEHMCPVCIASTAVIVAGAGSTGGILAVCIGKFRRIFRTNRPGLFQKTKENYDGNK
jgi:hypothetical protein